MNAELEKYIQELESGKLIYPRDICQKYNMDMQSCYRLLEKLTDQKLLNSVLKIICPTCNHIDDKIHQTFMELPSKYTCPVCGQDADVLLDSYVIYQKI